VVLQYPVQPMLQSFHETFFVFTKNIRPITASLSLPLSRPRQRQFLFIESTADLNEAGPASYFRTLPLLAQLFGSSQRPLFYLDARRRA
jgi:hypothetical protein